MERHPYADHRESLFKSWDHVIEPLSNSTIPAHAAQRDENLARFFKRLRNFAEAEVPAACNANHEASYDHVQYAIDLAIGRLRQDVTGNPDNDKVIDESLQSHYHEVKDAIERLHRDQSNLPPRFTNRG